MEAMRGGDAERQWAAAMRGGDAERQWAAAMRGSDERGRMKNTRLRMGHWT